MWKKIGSIGPASNDNKSSRSRDQNAYQPFSQMSKIRVSDVQFMDESTELFCPNFLSKKKGLESKYFSQSKIQTAQQFSQIQSYNDIPQDIKGSLIKKKTLNRNQMDEMKQRISQKIIDSIDDSLDKGQKTAEQQNLLKTDSTEIIGSQTSLDEEVKKLKHVKSTPQFKFSQIGDISEEISLDKKVEAQKNMKALRKEHTEIKMMIKDEVKDFKKFFESVEKQIKGHIAQAIEKNRNAQNKEVEISGLVAKKEREKLLSLSEIGNRTESFTDKFKDLNSKKAETMKRLLSLRQR